MDMDRNLKKLGQPFRVLMPCLKKSPKTFLWFVLHGDICLKSTLFAYFVYGKGTK